LSVGNGTCRGDLHYGGWLGGRTVRWPKGTDAHSHAEHAHAHAAKVLVLVAVIVVVVPVIVVVAASVVVVATAVVAVIVVGAGRLCDRQGGGLLVGELLFVVASLGGRRVALLALCALVHLVLPADVDGLEV